MQHTIQSSEAVAIETGTASDPITIPSTKSFTALFVYDVGSGRKDRRARRPFRQRDRVARGVSGGSKQGATSTRGTEQELLQLMNVMFGPHDARAALSHRDHPLDDYGCKKLDAAFPQSTNDAAGAPKFALINRWRIAICVRVVRLNVSTNPLDKVGSK